MANDQKKIRVPRIQTPWEPASNRNEEVVYQDIYNWLRKLEDVKLEAAQFNASGAAYGDILVADTNLVFQPQKYVPLTFGVGTDLSVTGTATVTGNTILKGTLGVSGLTAIGGALNVSGAGFVVGNHSVGGNLAVTGVAAVSGLVTCTSGFIVSRGQVANRDTDFISEWRSGIGGTSRVQITYDGSASRIRTLSPNGANATSIDTSNGTTNITTLGNFSFMGAGTGFQMALANDGAAGVYLIINNNTALFLFGPTDQPKVRVLGADGQTAVLQRWEMSDQTTIASVGASGSTIIRPLDALTSALTTALTLGHKSTGTPGAGFGAKIALQLKSSTTDDRDAGGLTWEWEVATEGSQIGLGKLTAYYITTEREVMQWGATSSKPTIGFLGATRAIQQTGGAATAGLVYTATEQGMLQAAYNALRTFGFLS